MPNPRPVHQYITPATQSQKHTRLQQQQRTNCKSEAQITITDRTKKDEIQHTRKKKTNTFGANVNYILSSHRHAARQFQTDEPSRYYVLVFIFKNV